MTIEATQVAEFLKQNPDFFESNITLLTDVDIPHPHGGRTISISERQILALREKNKLVETKLAELIQFGEENDSISEKIHHFSCALLQAKDLSSTLNAIYTNLRENFAVPYIAIRLWHPALSYTAIKETESVGEEVRLFVDNLKTPYCGTHAVYDSSHWFESNSSELRSFAMIKLAGKETFGAILLASEDSQRFYAEMGTLYLNRLSELISAAIEANAS